MNGTAEIVVKGEVAATFGRFLVGLVDGRISLKDMAAELLGYHEEYEAALKAAREADELTARMRQANEIKTKLKRR